MNKTHYRLREISRTAEVCPDMKIEVIRSKYNDIIWLKQTREYSSSGNDSGKNSERMGGGKIEITQAEK